jgi:hypothetical protein
MSTPEGRTFLLSIITLLVGLGVPIAFPEVDPIWGYYLLIAAGVLAVSTSLVYRRS